MSYPQNPGHKATDTETSAAAAKTITVEANTLRDHCEAALKTKDMTADEVAKAVNKSVLSVRPRISELKKIGRAAATASRRCNVSGHSAVVWGWVKPSVPQQQEML